QCMHSHSVWSLCSEAPLSLAGFLSLDILSVIYIRMPTVQQGSLRQLLVEAVSILARHHLEAVISSLLSKRLPMDRYILLATSENSVMMLRRDVLFSVLSFQATCAIFEVVSALQSCTDVQKLLPELSAALLQQVSRTVGQEMPMPGMNSRRRLFRKGQHLCSALFLRLSIEALEAVLSKGVNERQMRMLRNQNTWILLENAETHHEGVCLSELITAEIVQSLLPWMNSPTENGRVTSTAFFAELMSDPMLREKKFLKCVLQILEAKSRDENRIVCQMAIRGLGNIVYGAPEKVKKHKKTLLKVLIRSLNERSHSEIVCESLKALAKVLKELKEKDIGSSFRDLTTRIRTYLDNEDDGLRSLAFALFGILARSAKSKWKAYFAAQVRESWVTLMLHLQDPKASCMTISIPKGLPGSVGPLPRSQSFLQAFCPGILTGESLLLLEQRSSQGEKVHLNEPRTW
uniref:Maestro heat-like repeat family member 5 n=1 Tax=Pelusios castaneus TaxID=367368 RepID=A0A8C8S7W2_9SAUR